MDIKPQILIHPNIPKPLHGINPRTINGTEWWNKIRGKVYEKYDYHCAACGTHKSEAKKHKWLEAHEFWDINYLTGVCKVDKIEPLCHYCHNFIHSGRLTMIMGSKKSKSEVFDILQHGFDVLSKTNLECFGYTYDLAVSMGVNTYNIRPYKLRINNNLRWMDYVLIYNKKEYRSKFNNIDEWINFYKKSKNR